MKHILTAILFSLTICSVGNASIPVIKEMKAIPEYLKTENFMKLSVNEFETASGQHLNFFQRMYFKKLQRQLSRSDFKKDSTILEYYNPEKAKFKFDPLWFVLGCFIGPLALLFSFTSKQPRSKKISALIGLPVFILWFGWLTIF